MNPLQLRAEWRYFKNLGDVEDQGQKQCWSGVLDDEAIEADPSVSVVVMVSQANSLRKDLYIFNSIKHRAHFVSLNCDGHREEDAGGEADVRETVKDGIDGEKDRAVDVECDGAHHDVTQEEARVCQAQTRE